MKNKIKNILLLVGFGVIIWMAWNPRIVTEVKTKTVTLPPIKGDIEYVKIDSIVRDTVYLPSKKEIVVDQKYKRMYEEVQDSLEKQALYLEAIRIRDYQKVFVDNDTIKIGGTITTRGSLVGYKFDYLIKESKHTYIPEVYYQYPRFGLGLGIEAGVPTTLEDRFVLKGNFILTRGNNNFSISYDTNGMIWGGFTKTLKIY